MAEKGRRFVGAALTVTLAGGCAPDVSAQMAPMDPVRRAVLDCPNLPGQDGSSHVILDNLTPGQKIIVSNRATELSPHYIEVQEDGQFAVLGQNPRQREPGEQFAASGYPDDDATIYDVVAGKPEFSPTSNEMRWVDAGSAITAFCIVPGLRSPYGYFVPAGHTAMAPIASQG